MLTKRGLATKRYAICIAIAMENNSSSTCINITRHPIFLRYDFTDQLQASSNHFIWGAPHAFTPCVVIPTWHCYTPITHLFALWIPHSFVHCPMSESLWIPIGLQTDMMPSSDPRPTDQCSGCWASSRGSDSPLFVACDHSTDWWMTSWGWKNHQIIF